MHMVAVRGYRRRPRLLQSNLRSLRRRLRSISKIAWLLTPLVHVRNVLTERDSSDVCDTNSGGW